MTLRKSVRAKYHQSGVNKMLCNTTIHHRGTHFNYDTNDLFRDIEREANCKQKTDPVDLHLAATCTIYVEDAKQLDVMQYIVCNLFFVILMETRIYPYFTVVVNIVDHSRWDETLRSSP